MKPYGIEPAAHTAGLFYGSQMSKTKGDEHRRADEKDKNCLDSYSVIHD